VQGPQSPDKWRQAILADRPHVLLYPEIGMNHEVGALAAQRLAPVQCMSLGHPDTSGFPTMDYFLSSDLMEPADADDHYTEKLVRLPNISVYYEPLETILPPVTRAELGIREGVTAFWCGQSLFKYLPQHDGVFPRIAQEVKDCQFVFIEHPKGAAATRDFGARLDRAFQAVGLNASDYCVILPRREQHAFVAAIGTCDIVLDSVGWSGFNSTIEGLVHDLPIVTLKGPLMRGAHTAAVLTMMGMQDTIADTVDGHVAIAARLARDPDWRAAIKARMAADKHRVYRDRACIEALQDFLERVARPS
jgi:predicted O-linked N-acetylglucosamine transferase (SPINDLY family)